MEPASIAANAVPAPPGDFRELRRGGSPGGGGLSCSSTTTNCALLRLHTLLVLASVLCLALFPIPALPAKAMPELCVVRALDSRFIEPWVSQSRRAIGCSSHGRLGPGGAEVHAIRVILLSGNHDISSNDWALEKGLPLLELVLNATPHNASATPLVLLLGTDRPVTWRVTANGVRNDVKHSFTICKECEVEENPLIRASSILRSDWQSKRSLLKHVNRTWHALTSFTEVHVANRIELKVGYGVAGEESIACETGSRLQSPVAAASFKIRQPSEGCLHEDSIGHNARDLYVVEVLQGRGSMPGAVQVLLQGEGPRPVARNLTLVLKSARPARWQLSSRGIDGSIVVVSDQQVENSGSDVVVRSKHLPDGLGNLLLSFFSEYGRPVLYAKTEKASGLRLLVPSKEYVLFRTSDEEKLSGDMAGDERDSAVTLQQVMPQANIPGATFFSGLQTEESRAHHLSDLGRGMKVSCEPKRMNVSFPRNLVTRLGVQRLSLNDPSCVSQSNATHVWLSSHMTSCGSLSSSVDEATFYSNSVHIKFGPSAPSDDEDGGEEEASGAFEDPDKDANKLNVLCKYMPMLWSSGIEEADGIAVESVETNGGNMMPQNNIYQMELFLDQNHTERLSPPHPSRDSPSLIFMDEMLHVRTWMDGTKKVQVVIDSCWVSNSSSPQYHHLRVLLIRNACPVDFSVSITDPMGPGTRPQHGGFSFQINKAYQQYGQLYLHCKLGLCTPDHAHARGNLVLCMNQAQHCFRDSLRPSSPKDTMVPTAQQMVSRGPLRLGPGRRSKPGPPSTPLQPSGTRSPPMVEAQPPTDEATSEATSVEQGISMTMATAIALLSFVIGVFLTASMWCIQVKTDPARRRRSKELVQQQQRAAAAAAALGTPGAPSSHQEASSAAI